MSKKSKKAKRSKPMPKVVEQYSRSSVRPLQSTTPNEIVLKAQEYPIFGCWVMESWQDMGITPVVVARRQDNDRILFGVYMVDYYCLGVKSAYTRADYSLNRFNRELPKLCADAPAPCSVDLAHELIYGSIEYAQKLGFEPDPDFYTTHADKILDPPDAHPRSGSVTFGKDGKPFYIPGPHDSPVKSNFVMTTLTRTCGPGNFNYLLIGNMPDDIG